MAQHTNSPRDRRRLHVVDIENQAGCPPRDLAPRAVSELVTAYQRRVGLRAGDHAIIACNPAWIFPVQDAWHPCSLHSARGPSGADDALLSHVDPIQAARSYGEVWIGSGDRAFADLARMLGRKDCQVVVVARPGQLARVLAAHADRIVWFVDRPLNDITTEPGVAA